jgi:hypothetical protein
MDSVDLVDLDFLVGAIFYEVRAIVSGGGGGGGGGENQECVQYVITW